MCQIYNSREIFVCLFCTFCNTFLTCSGNFLHVNLTLTWKLHMCSNHAKTLTIICVKQIVNWFAENVKVYRMIWILNWICFVEIFERCIHLVNFLCTCIQNNTNFGITISFLFSNFMRSECLNSRYAYDSPLPVSRLVSAVGNSILLIQKNLNIRSTGSSIVLIYRYMYLACSVKESSKSEICANHCIFHFDHNFIDYGKLSIPT